MATHIDVDVRSERRRFVEAIAPARFQRKIIKFLDQNGGPTLERADDRKQAKWMQACADKGFLFAMVFHRCVDGCCCVAAVLRLRLLLCCDCVAMADVAALRLRLRCVCVRPCLCLWSYVSARSHSLRGCVAVKIVVGYSKWTSLMRGYLSMLRRVRLQ